MFEDFYKPTKQKIILAILIMLIHVGVAFYSATAMLCTQFCPEPNLIQKVAFPTVYPFLYLSFITEFFEDILFLSEPVQTVLISVVSLFVLVLFWYSISCGIIKIRSKIHQSK